MMTISSEERLFALLVEEAEAAQAGLGDGAERDELCRAIVGLERRLAIIRSRDER